MKDLTEIAKRIALLCGGTSAAIVIGAALILPSIDKNPEQQVSVNEKPVPVPYTSTIDWSELEITESLIAAEEGEESARLGAAQIAQATSGASNSNSEINNSGTNNSGEGDTDTEEPEEDFIRELDGHDTNKLYMQDVTYDEIMDWEYQSIHTVTDRRTDIDYEVYKGYDGYGNDTLYMSSDLRLGSNDKKMILTPANTNIYSDYYLPAGADNEGTYTASVLLADSVPSLEWLTSEDYNAYDVEESICPSGWRIPAFFEPFRNSDLNSITSFNRETSSLKNTVGINSDNSLLASSTIRVGSDVKLIAEGESYEEVPFDSDTALHLKCMFGDPIVIARHFTLDFNGGTEYNDETGEYDLTSYEEDLTLFSSWGLEYYPGFYPEKEGYSFIGWSKNKNATVPDEGTSMDYITLNIKDGKNLTYYAVYQKDVTITFNANGGTFDYDDPTATVNVAVYTPSPIKTISSKKVDGTRKTSGEDMSTYMDGYAEYNELDFGYDGPVRMHMIYNVADGDVLCMNESGTTKQDHLNQLNSTDPSCFFFQGDYPLTMPGSLNLPIMYLENNTIETAALFKGSRLGIAFYSLASSENFGDEYGYYVEATISRGAKEGYYDIPYNDDEEKRFVGWATSPNATVPEYEAMDDMNDMVGRSVDFIREDTTLYAVWGNQVAH